MKRFIEALERVIRQVIVYPLLRVAFRNQTSSARIDLAGVKSILIFRYDRIGDMILTTPILRALKHDNPRLRLGVIASRTNAEILATSPWVDDLFVLETNWIRLLRQVRDLRRRRYDIVLNFIFNRTTGPGILANLIAPKGFKVGQGPDRYAFYFNRLLKLPRFEQHMVESLASFVEQVFGTSLTGDELGFEIGVGEGARGQVDGFLSDHYLRRRSSPGGNMAPYVVFNLSANDSERKITVDQAALLADHLSRKPDFRTVLLYAPGDATMRQAVESIEKFAGCIIYRTQGDGPLGQIASLIDGALVVLTPDTAIIHFASAMRTPVVGFYTRLQGMQEWMPYRVPHEIVVAPLGEPAGSIQPAVMIERAEAFISSMLHSTRATMSGAA